MGRKCSVENCLSDSNRQEDAGVTFHKVPLHPDVRPKWLSLCRIPDDKKNAKVIYVCSRHFLRADFCSFKGRKYMLRQGVLPSVFPWDKSKLEALKAEGKKDPELESGVSDNLKSADCGKTETNVKKDSKTGKSKERKPENVSAEENEVKQELSSEDGESPEDSDSKTEEQNPIDSSLKMQTKHKFKQKLEDFVKSKMQQNVNPSINFSINSKIEALDFNDMWYPARIVEVDYEENEVLIHFEKFSSKYDEWISMNSSRLRPVQTTPKKSVDKYSIGERCMASWSDCRKFPATVKKILENDTYEVLFDDGYAKTLKSHRMSKTQGKISHAAPLFDPIKSTKQERRDKKRKINSVATLFGKRPRMAQDDKSKPSTSSVAQMSPNLDVSATNLDENSQWHPQWENGKPVGTESTIETSNGPRKSVIVADPRIPAGWTKHLTQRVSGSCAGKWNTVIVAPDNKRFRARSEIKAYLENYPDLGLDENLFDFSIYRTGASRNSGVHKPSKKAEPDIHQSEEIPEKVPPKEEDVTEEPPVSLKIIFEDDAYKCPIDGCGKNFRRENLALMHVKHYHSEYTKYLDSTPNVADLAYARTVGENLEKSPGPQKLNSVAPRQVEKASTPKTARVSAQLPPSVEPVKDSDPTAKLKDTEIIKLLNQKPFDNKETEVGQSLPPGLPTNKYPDIKLKDLLNKAEDVPRRDDINIKALCNTRPPMGIKTILPVVRSQPEVSDEKRTSSKRKRGLSENTEVVKSKELPPAATQLVSTQPSSPQLPHSPSPQPPLSTDATHSEIPSPVDNIIIEGGKIIKLERMKQEEIINCTCGYTEEDGLMIQCELCLCWQHAFCNNIQRESEVPEKYVCYICQHPLRERTSMKYIHDQDWLKMGVLPTASYHSKDEQLLQKRYEKLKKSHDISGGLLELKEYLHAMSLKLKIAEAKNHPKLYLWSKPWEKNNLPEKDFKNEEKPDLHKPKAEQDCDEKTEVPNDSMLMMILKGEKEDMPKIDLNTFMNNNIANAPIIPQPEAAINSDDCRLNLLEHISHSESLVEERLDDFEKQIEALEEGLNMDMDENYPKTRQTLQMLIRDLDTLRELSHNPMI